jgi:hypothetical protein
VGPFGAVAGAQTDDDVAGLGEALEGRGKLDLPEATSVSGDTRRKKKKEESHEPPAAPSVTPRQPDAPRPSDVHT